MPPRRLCFILLSSILLFTPEAYPQKRSIKPEYDGTSVFLPAVSGRTTQILASAFNYAIYENFEGSFPPAGWTVINPDGGRTWQRTTLASGFGNGNASARVSFYNYNPNSGQVDSLKTPIITGLVAGDSLAFDYAYCEFPSGTLGPDTVEVYLSTDGGTSFGTLLATLSEPDSTTGPTTDDWAPASNEWETQRIELPISIVGASVQLVFISHNHFAQNFYIDNVQIGSQPNDDIQALSLDDPSNGDEVVEMVPFSPTATFKNVGSATEFAFDVRYEVITSSSVVFYSNTKTIASLVSGATQQVTFDPVSLPEGEYTIRATSLLVIDANTANDTVAGSITSLLRVTSFPYYQDFEGVAEGGWSSKTVSGSKNDWIRGTPNKPNQLTGAHSGTNAWVTLLDTTYSDNHNAALISPLFDLSAVSENFIIEFYHNFRMESGWDGSVLEYSTNLGSSWSRVNNVLGTGSDFYTTRSRRWYNSSSTNGNLTPNKWSESSTFYATHSSGWVRSTSGLSSLAGQPNVRFRWRFRTDETNVDEGWAVDDVAIYGDSTKHVFIPMNAGWNGVSNPVGSDVDSVFLGGPPFNYLFCYDIRAGYHPCDTMPQGEGFWLKLPGAWTFIVDGRLIEQDSIPVASGWNFIGSISIPAAVSLITSEPPGIIASPFFGYSGGYTTSPTIEPGKAYWVKASEPGVLILTGNWAAPPPATETSQQGN